MNMNAPSSKATSLVLTTLSSPKMVLLSAVLAMVLVLSSLGVGWVLDDHHQRLRFVSERWPDLINTPIRDMFLFLDGNPDTAQRMIDVGFFPWWTRTDLLARFWRPVTAMTHWVDYALWPDTAWLMHAHSILWYGFLVAAVGVLFRKLIGQAWVAGLAMLIYAIDDAHGMPVGFLANRNSLVAAFFGVLAVLAHHKWRGEGQRRWLAVGPVLYCMSLLSAEAGVSSLAYLLAYALALDRGTWRARCVSLIPYIAVTVVWRLVWASLGCGVTHFDLYIDPVRQPLEFIMALFERVPFLLAGQWAFPPSDTAAGIFIFGIQGAWIVRSFVVITAIVVGAASFIVARRDRQMRFWALGMAFSIIPICSPPPQDRLLVFTGIGASALIAQILASISGAKSSHRTRSVRLMFRAAAWFLVAVHLVIAPILLVARAAYPVGRESLLDGLHVPRPLDAAVEEQDVIIVNPPSFLNSYLPTLSEVNGQPVPRHTRILATGIPSMEVFRPDERTLVIRPAFGLFASRLDRFLLGKDGRMDLGQRVELTGMSVEITGLRDDGRPSEATFRFDKSLEDPSLNWLQWKDQAFTRFTPPGIGESVTLRCFFHVGPLKVG